MDYWVVILCLSLYKYLFLYTIICSIVIIENCVIDNVLIYLSIIFFYCKM